MMPAPKVSEAIAGETKSKEDDMMAAMRTQSTYFMPLMTVFIGWSFSLGLLLYWFTTSALMIGQQLLVNKTTKK
jgi:membrane protein insertase Oxa1/YidC/SpoIIIJ